MYKIIGADQKEYGPISADQIRQWISEGRVNRETMACAEGSSDWKPLEQFPEFGLAAGPTASGFPRAQSSRPLSEDELLASDYTLDIGACASQSWELVKANFWPVIGITLVNSIALNAINQLLGLISKPGMDAMIKSHQFSPSAAALFAGTLLAGMPFSTVLMGGFVPVLFKNYSRSTRYAIGLTPFTIGFSQMAPFWNVSNKVAIRWALFTRLSAFHRPFAFASFMIPEFISAVNVAFFAFRRSLTGKWISGVPWSVGKVVHKALVHGLWIHAGNGFVGSCRSCRLLHRGYSVAARWNDGHRTWI